MPNVTKQSNRGEESFAKDNALRQCNVEEVQHLSVDQIATLKQLLKHGDSMGVWATPQRWTPSVSRPCLLKVQLRLRIFHFLTPELRPLFLDQPSSTTPISPDLVEKAKKLLAAAISSSERYLILLRVGPSGMGDRGANRSLKPSVIIQIAYRTLPRLCALAIRKILEHPGGTFSLDGTQSQYDNLLFSELSFEDLSGLSLSARNEALAELNRMSKLAGMGLLNYKISSGRAPFATTKVAGPELSLEPERINEPHLPLPDEYVSGMGFRSLWLMNEIGPNALRAAEKINEIFAKPLSGANAEYVKNYRRNELEKLFASFEWLDRSGCPLSEPPFVLALSKRGKNSNFGKTGRPSGLSKPWPPRSFAQAMSLMQLVQMAHMFVVLIATGDRKSEAVSMERNCVVHSPNGLPYANGLTFKLAHKVGGKVREWVLPDVAVAALEQQARLISAVERIGALTPDLGATTNAALSEEPTHLWTQMFGSARSDRTKPLPDLHGALLSYAEAIGMDLQPGGQSLRPHRFRKTVARLVALALTRSPRILMRIFGHSSIEMTLHYILSDRELAAEIDKVARELRVVRAKELVNDIVEAEFSQTYAAESLHGGPAAEFIRESIKSQRHQLHRRGEEWGAQDTYELAEALTLQGEAWQYVRPGVICTKFPGTEIALCNNSRGNPSPDKCVSHCRHRFEESFLREDVDHSIEAGIQNWLIAVAKQDVLMKSFWAAQVRSQLPRFQDLMAKWSEDPSVRAILTESK